jgi:hypothetical protein
MKLVDARYLKGLPVNIFAWQSSLTAVLSDAASRPAYPLAQQPKR